MQFCRFINLVFFVCAFFVILSFGDLRTDAFGQEVPLGFETLTVNQEGAQRYDAFDIPNPSLATDAAGNWVMLWNCCQQLSGTVPEGGQVAVSISPDNDTNWSVPVSLTGYDYISENTVSNFVATDGAGTWLSLLGGIPGGDEGHFTGVATSLDNGATWTAPQEGPFGNLPFGLAAGSSSTWIASSSLAQASLPMQIIPFAGSTDDGETWTSLGFPMGEGLGPPLMATNGSNTWVAVWALSEAIPGSVDGETQSSLYFSRSVDNGATWSAAALLDVAPPEGTLAIPGDMSTDGKGNWLVSWSRYDASVKQSRIHLSRSSDNGQTWETIVDALAFGDLATDGNGNWLSVVARFEDGRGILEAAHSTDNGATWLGYELLNAERMLANPVVAVGQDNRWVIAFSRLSLDSETLEQRWDVVAIASENLGSGGGTGIACAAGGSEGAWTLRGRFGDVCVLFAAGTLLLLTSLIRPCP